MPRKVEAHNIL